MKRSFLCLTMVVSLSIVGGSVVSAYADGGTGTYGNAAWLENLSDHGVGAKTTEKRSGKENTTLKADSGIRSTAGQYGDHAIEENLNQ
ncbi:MAG: hypothetical protein HQL01_14790 [Nitrospirae bacterium]|nr:hypothetical protein [Nitrospirota bacterium]